jgi:hypothetical protein
MQLASLQPEAGKIEVTITERAQRAERERTDLRRNGRKNTYTEEQEQTFLPRSN